MSQNHRETKFDKQLCKFVKILQLVKENKATECDQLEQRFE
jgi:hypothetical protein